MRDGVWINNDVASLLMLNKTIRRFVLNHQCFKFGMKLSTVPNIIDFQTGLELPMLVPFLAEPGFFENQISFLEINCKEGNVHTLHPFLSRFKSLKSLTILNPLTTAYDLTSRYPFNSQETTPPIWTPETFFIRILPESLSKTLKHFGFIQTIEGPHPITDNYTEFLQNLKFSTLKTLFPSLESLKLELETFNSKVRVSDFPIGLKFLSLKIPYSTYHCTFGGLNSDYYVSNDIETGYLRKSIFGEEFETSLPYLQHLEIGLGRNNIQVNQDTFMFFHVIGTHSKLKRLTITDGKIDDLFKYNSTTDEFEQNYIILPKCSFIGLEQVDSFFPIISLDQPNLKTININTNWWSWPHNDHKFTSYNSQPSYIPFVDDSGKTNDDLHKRASQLEINVNIDFSAINGIIQYSDNMANFHLKFAKKMIESILSGFKPFTKIYTNSNYIILIKPRLDIFKHPVIANHSQDLISLLPSTLKIVNS